MTVIKKLKNANIFKNNSLIKTVITKEWMGSPVNVDSVLIVKELKNNHCICEEYNEASGKAHKIKYIDITSIDGMDPLELAAVYGLAPKTERFKKRRSQ